MSQGSQIEAFVADIIYGRRRDGWARVIAAILRGLSWIFRGVVNLRIWLYEKRGIRPAYPGVQVIAVGNLTVGGTGKTPVVEGLARVLQARGRRVAVLSRGYKSRQESLWKRIGRRLAHIPPPPPKVVSDGQNVLLDSEVAGDEPYMLARNLPGVFVLVDKNRVKAAHYAVRQYGVDTLILDDGFQYLKLKAHLNLLLVDSRDPFGNRALLPRGILREPVEHLRRASYILVTKSDGKADPALLAELRSHKPNLEIVECSHSPKYLERVADRKQEPLEALRDSRILALSAIATPESFEVMLEKRGAELVERWRFLDHHRFTEAELSRVIERARERRCDMIVTTEKDAVRLPADLKSEVPWYFLRLEVEILRGFRDFEEAVARMGFSQREPGRLGSLGETSPKVVPDGSESLALALPSRRGPSA